MRIVVAGASGMIGAPLVRRWRAAGHDVLRLVRREATAPGEVRWDPASGSVDDAVLDGADAVVDLAGAGVGDHRWTAAYRRVVLESRTQTTATLARAVARADRPPAVLLQASASGYYGDRGDDVLTESSLPAEGFLARVCVAWEAAAAPARAAGVRVVLLRTGLVLGRDGGAAGALLPLVRLGLGGPLGSGRAWWSWITLEDQVRAIDYLLTGDVVGPVNLVAPQPARNGDVIRAIAAAHHRPAALAVPGWALRAAIGEFAEEVLASRRVLPRVLEGAGFTFDHPDVGTAARWLAAA